MLETTKWKDKLIDLGANPFLKGFRCTIEALKLIDEEKGEKVKMMYLYETVGKKTENTSLNVERTIRHFLANMRKNSKGAEVIGEKGSNSETLYLLYHKLKEEQKGEVEE